MISVLASKKKSQFWRIATSCLFIAVPCFIVWIYYLNTTHLTGKLLKEERLSELFDSLGESLLNGSTEVPLRAVKYERFTVNGRIVTYFGAFPAFLRIVANRLYEKGVNRWARISCLVASLLAIFFVFLIAQLQLGKNEHISVRQRFWLLFVTVNGFAFASPLFYLASAPTVYHEAIIWGLAWSLGAIYFILSAKRGQARSYLGFSIAASCCLLSRPTFAVPHLLIALFFFVKEVRLLYVFRSVKVQQVVLILCLVTPLFFAGIFQAWYNFDRFGSPLVFVDYQYYPRDIAAAGGAFRIDRIPDALYNYFIPRLSYFSSEFPFVRMEMPYFSQPELILGSERALSILLASSWLMAGAFWCFGSLLRRSRLECGLIISFLIQGPLACSFCFFSMRYSAEFLPLLILAFVIFLSKVSNCSSVNRFFLGPVLAILLLFSSWVSVLSTWEWSVTDNHDFIRDKDKIQEVTKNICTLNIFKSSSLCNNR